MLPRALSKQSRTTASAPKPASEPEPVASTSKLDEEASSLTIAPGTDLSLDNEANLIFDIETVLSDFGLYRDPELLSRVKSSQDGASIHLSTLALLPALAEYSLNTAKLKQYLEQSPPSRLRLDPDTNYLHRLKPLAKDVENVDWAARCYYAENLPPLSYDLTTPDEVRSFLSSALDTLVQTVHFPPVASSSNHPQSQHPPQDFLSKGIFQTQRTRTYGTDEEKARDIASRLPAGGGTYKRFVFCVLGDDSAVRSAQLDWGWNRNLEAQPKDTSESTSGAGAEASRKEIADDEESDADDLDEMAEQLNGKLSPKKQRKEADMSPLELSRLHGLRMLSLSEWRRLRHEYQNYAERLTRLKDAEEQTHQPYNASNWNDHESEEQRQPGRADGDWRAARDEQHQKTQKLEEAFFPKGCVVFVQHVNPQATRGTLRNLAQNVMREAGDESAQVLYVNYEKGMNSARFRCSSPEAALTLRDYLQQHLVIMMDHTADSPEKLTPEESEAAAEAKFDCLTPEILEGRKEAAYWADVPVHARYPNQSQKQGEKKSKKRPREEAEVVKKSEAQSVTTEPESGQQHIRFE